MRRDEENKQADEEEEKGKKDQERNPCSMI